MEYRLARTNEEKGYKILKVYEENGKLYAECRRECERCGGAGEIPYFGHIDSGVCFKCSGAKYFYNTFRAYTEAERAKLDEAYEKKQAKKDAEMRAKAGESKKAWLEKRGLAEDLFIVAGANTYGIKDKLKEAGARYYDGLGWFFTLENKDKMETLDIPDVYFLHHVKFSDIFEWNDYGTAAFYKTDALDSIKESIDNIIKAKNADATKSKHYGNIGERIRKVNATLESAKTINGEWGGSILYTFKIGDDVFTWFTQSILDDEIRVGDKIILSGTIKAHTEYAGVPQTQLSRCIVKPVE